MLKITENWVEQDPVEYLSFEGIDSDAFEEVKFPCFLKVHGNFSNYFDWSSWDGYECLSEEPEWLQDGHGGSIECGEWVHSPQEAVEYLLSFKGSRYTGNDIDECNVNIVTDYCSINWYYNSRWEEQDPAKIEWLGRAKGWGRARKLTHLQWVKKQCENNESMAAEAIDSLSI